MVYLNNAYKFVAVLNSKVALPQLMNALGHLAAGLAAELGEAGVNYLEYKNLEHEFQSKIAEAPFIILKSKNSRQIGTLREAAKDAGLAHNTFVSTMVGNSAEEQISRTLTAQGESLEYWAIVLYGDGQKLALITKKFSLFSVAPIEQGGQDDAS